MLVHRRNVPSRIGALASMQGRGFIQTRSAENCMATVWYHPPCMYAGIHRSGDVLGKWPGQHRDTAGRGLT